MNSENEGDGIPFVDQEGAAIRLPEIEQAANLLAEKVEDPPVLIDGLLHQGSKVVVGGGSKSFKTFILLYLALAVATGNLWWERATTKGRVLFINFELQRPFLRRRLMAIAKALGIEWKTMELDVWNLRGHAADIETLRPEMVARIKERGYVLIVFDPIYKCLGNREENNAGDIASLMNELERIAVMSGAAVAIGAHFSKGNQAGRDSIDRISGSGVYARDPDTILTLTRHAEQDAFTVEATLRNFPPTEPFCVKWEHPLMMVDEALNPEDLKQKAGGKRIPTDEEFVALLPPFGIGSKPQECLMTNDEVKAQLKLHGFNKDALAAVRDGAEKRQAIRVIVQARGKLLIGIPEAVEAFLAEGAGGSNGAAKRKRTEAQTK